jgi:transposase
MLKGFRAYLDEINPIPGIYPMAKFMRVSLISIRELSRIPETLWMRILGKGAVQEQAIQELLTLPKDDPRRVVTLELLLNWSVARIETSDLVKDDEEDQRLLMQLTTLYRQRLEEKLEEGEQLGELRGRRSLILRLLNRRCGQELPSELRSQIELLSLEQLDALGEALLEFGTLRADGQTNAIADLEDWLTLNR